MMKRFVNQVSFLTGTWFEATAVILLRWAIRFYHNSDHHQEEIVPKVMVEAGARQIIREVRELAAGQN